MDRKEDAVIDDLDGLARLGDLAQQELHEGVCFRPRQQERRHRLDDGRQCGACGLRVLRQVAGSGKGAPGDAGHGIHDVICAGDPQALLVAEVVRDRPDIRLRGGSDFARRGRVEPLFAEQGEPGADQGLACLFRRPAVRQLAFLGHATILINRLIKSSANIRLALSRRPRFYERWPRKSNANS